MRAILFLFAVSIGAFAPARAETPPSLAPTTAASNDAHPALWTAHGKHGTVYLLGSIHILPPDEHWRTPAIEQAIDKADVFAFEIPTDAKAAMELREMVAERGMLPPDKSLHEMLTPEAQRDLDKAIALAGVPPDAVDRQRPWLAGLTLTISRMMHTHDLASESGVDRVLAREATARHKELRFMETMKQQLDLLAPKHDDKMEIEEFQSGLKDFLTENDDTELNQLIAAWAHGNPQEIDRLFNKSLAKYPDLRKMLLEDRNKAWVKKIEPMLDNEDKVFLITVGAGHLVGQTGVPNLLRKAGYKVDGP
ncbi:MAG TPA: TraB/GumN family protein [Rhizomicrobium sp.]